VLQLLRRPYGSVIRALIGHGAHALCSAKVESEVLRRLVPSAANQIGVVLPGVDLATIEAARPFAYPGSVVVAAGRLERHKRIDRAIAAMAALDPEFRLAVVGAGPAREKLLAHAEDLRVSSRVNFVGSVADAELYRWLRTASVVVALADQEFSGQHVTEALCARAQVVASDIPVHRESAFDAGVGVTFVSATGSPLDVADQISEAASVSVPQQLRLELPTWDETVDRTLAVYRAVIHGISRVAVVGS
jgi:glycosyltransferase involved in cell wall biosynthesis